MKLTRLVRVKNRIEIRSFAGTLNKTKPIGYVQMILGLAEFALNTKSCLDRPEADDGESELNRLF